MFACYKRIGLEYKNQVIENMLFLIQNWIVLNIEKAATRKVEDNLSLCDGMPLLAG